MNNSKFMFMLPDEMRDELQKLADDYNVSLATIIKMAIKEYLENR